MQYGLEVGETGALVNDEALDLVAATGIGVACALAVAWSA